MSYGPPAGFVKNKNLVTIDKQLCNACAKCVEVCRVPGLLKLKKEEKVFAYVTDAKKCAGCMRCMNACPTHAISVSFSKI